MAAGLRQAEAAIEEARTVEEAGTECHRHAVITPCYIAHTGEPATQDMPQEFLGVLGTVGDRWLGRREVQGLKVNMDVVVDEARHQGEAFAIDALGRLRSTRSRR